MIRVDPGADIERVVKLFKKSEQTAGILAAWRRHSYFVGPAERRRMKSVAARKRRSSKGG